MAQPPGSVEAMARRAIQLLHNQERHGTMRRAAIARARDFSADIVVPQYEGVYHEALG